MASNYAWGIDVGNRALKAIRLVRDVDGLRVDDFEIIEHENVLSNAGDNKETLIQTALANFVQRHPGKIGAAAMSVSGQSSFARFIKLPPVEKKKIPEIVRFEAIQQIPFPLDDVEWSYQLFQEADSPDVEVGIFAMRRELIDRQIQVYRDVDINVQVVQMNPLAVYNAMYYDGRVKGTTMIMDLGAENTDLIIAEGESIWLRSIPIGGNNFTEVLAKQFKLNFQKAEELKRNAATSKYARQIFQAMRPVFADLVAEIQRSIGFYASVHRDSRIKRIIALGGTFRLPGLQKYLQQNLQLEVERVDRIAAGVPNDGKLAATFNENILSMVTAYGLAVQALDQGKITSSLLPAHIRREKMWKDKTKWFAGAAALFVIGTGIAIGRYYLDDFQFKQELATQQKIDQLVAQASGYDNQWAEIESRGAADRQRINNVRSLLDYRKTWSSLVDDILSSLPAPQPELLTGDAAKIKTIPRDQRKLILIDSIKSEYVPDLPSRVTPAGGAGGAPAGPNATPDIPNPSRGFVLTIVCTTPNADKYTFLSNTFIANLLKLGQNDPAMVKKGYAIARATIQTAIKISQDPARQGALQGSYSALQAEAAKKVVATPAPAAPPQPGGDTAALTVNPAFLDRITGEPVLDDWELTVEVIVLLDPPPPAPAAPAGGAAGAAAQAQ